MTRNYVRILCLNSISLYMFMIEFEYIVVTLEKFEAQNIYNWQFWASSF